MLFVLCCLVVLLSLASSGGVWAAGDVGPRRGTVPTPTPRVTPTKPPAPTPTRPPAGAPATPTRVTPPTRTPCLDCAAPEPPAVEDVLSLLVNVGGDEYTDRSGEVWLADQEYVAGLSTWGYLLPDADTGTFAGDRPISGTLDSALLQDERWAMAGYRFELPNGDYALSLYFAEQWVTMPGARVFTVRVQGKDTLRNLDIVAEAGAPFTGLQRVVTTTVGSGLLAIDFVPGAENPTLAALAIRRLLPPTPTPRPTNTPGPTETATPAPTATPADTPPPTPTATFSATASPSPTASATSTALAATARVAGIFPQAEAALRSGDGTVQARIASGAVSEAMTLVYVPEHNGRLPAANAGFTPGSAAFSLQAVTAAGEWLTTTLLQAPIELAVRYTEGDLKLARGEQSRLVLMTYNNEARTWLALETKVDAAAQTLRARTRRPALFALMVHRGTEADGAQPVSRLWLALALAGVAVALWAARRLRTTRKASAA